MLRQEVDAGSMVNLDTVSGNAPTVQVRPSGDLSAYDEPGNVSNGDVMQSDGLIHIVDGVLLPRSCP